METRTFEIRVCRGDGVSLGWVCRGVGLSWGGFVWGGFVVGWVCLGWVCRGMGLSGVGLSWGGFVVGGGGGLSVYLPNNYYLYHFFIIPLIDNHRENSADVFSFICLKLDFVK